VICKWRAVCVVCPDCKLPTQIIGLCSSADGELLVQAQCLQCKEKLSWRVFASALAYHALVEDLEDEKVKQVIKVLKPRTPVQPPLALPTAPPNLILSEQDRIELRGLGIADDP
jgi:hypothetical protein